MDTHNVSPLGGGWWWAEFIKVLYVFRNHTDIFIAFRCLLFASKKHKRSYVDSDMGAARLARSLIEV